MPSGKQYEMLFKLNAQANSGFKGAFSQAQAEFAKLGSQIQSLNRAQGDIGLPEAAGRHRPHPG